MQFRYTAILIAHVDDADGTLLGRLEFLLVQVESPRVTQQDRLGEAAVFTVSGRSHTFAKWPGLWRKEGSRTNRA
jgi:hypothetical protein